MRYYRCDRCKNEFDHNEYTVTTEHIGLTTPNFTNKSIGFEFDLCDDCRKDFENWFRQPSVDKAMEEARAKAHAHEKGEVTVLGLEDGRCICPVCGYVFDPIKVSSVKLSYTTVDKIEYYKSCPKCGSLFSDNINYINLKKEGGEVDDTTGTET